VTNVEYRCASKLFNWAGEVLDEMKLPEVIRRLSVPPIWSEKK